MRKFTIASIALFATVGLASGQDVPRSGSDRQRASIERRIHELEAQYEQLFGRYSASRTPGLEQQLRSTALQLEHTRAALEAMTGEHAGLAEHLNALDRAIELHQSTSNEMVRDLERRQAELADHDFAGSAEIARVMERTHELQAQAMLADPAQLARIAEQTQALARTSAAIQSAMQSQDVLAQQDRERARIAHQLDRVARDGRLLDSFDFGHELDKLYHDGPVAARAQQDPADSIWRAARDQMNRGNNAAAARLFGRIHTEQQYRKSTYRADALYWHAFALSRLGTEASIREAHALLTQLTREYPAEGRHADTNGLMATLQVRLAQMGSENAVREIHASAVADEARVAYGKAVRLSDVQAAEMATRAAVESAKLAGNAIVAQPVGAMVKDGDFGNFLAQGLPLSRLRSLSPQCAREEYEIQLIALNSLIRMDTAAALPVLREVMARRDECAAPLRESATMIMTRVKGTEAERMLADAARSDPDAGVRRSALIYLSSRNEDQAVGIATDALRNAQTDEDRQAAFRALAGMHNERAWTALREYAGRADLDNDTRRAAVAILGQSNDSTNRAFLRSLYARGGNDRELKEAILMSSAFRRGNSDPDWLLSIARNGNEEVRIREYAITMLSRNGDVTAAQFADLYDRAGEKRLKLAVLRVLGGRARTESEATDKLIAIARSETDMDFRRQAVLSLPSDDPRARDLLLEILRGK